MPRFRHTSVRRNRIYARRPRPSSRRSVPLVSRPEILAAVAAAQAVRLNSIRRRGASQANRRAILRRHNPR